MYAASTSPCPPYGERSSTSAVSSRPGSRPGADAVLLDLHGLAASGRRRSPRPGHRGRGPRPAARSAGGPRLVARGRARARPRPPRLTVVPAGRESEPCRLCRSPSSRSTSRSSSCSRLGAAHDRRPGASARIGPGRAPGPDGPRLRRLARGEDDGLFVPAREPAAFEMTLELDWPVDGWSRCPSCWPASSSRSARARGPRPPRGRPHPRPRPRGPLHPPPRAEAAAPSAEPRTWRTLVLLDLEAHPPRDAIQAITVRAEPTPARPVQFSLLDRPCPRPSAWRRPWRVFIHGPPPAAAARLPSRHHRPGAFVVGTFARGRWSGSRGRRPAPGALRSFRPPLPATWPCAARSGFRGRGGDPRRVAAHAGPWRASGTGGTWPGVARSGRGPRGSGPVRFRLCVYRIFRDRLREAWFVEGEMD